jgi:hypothetical protein
MKLLLSKLFFILNFIFNKYFMLCWIDFLKFYSLLKEYFSFYKENLGTVCLYILICLLRIFTDFFTFYYFPIFILYFFFNIIYFFLPNNLKIDKLSKIINFFKLDNYFNNNIVDKQIILYSNPVQVSSNNFLYKIFNILILFLSFLLIILLLFLRVIFLFSPIFLVYLIPNSNFFISMTIEITFFYQLIHFFFLNYM